MCSHNENKIFMNLFLLLKSKAAFLFFGNKTELQAKFERKCIIQSETCWRFIFFIHYVVSNESKIVSISDVVFWVNIWDKSLNKFRYLQASLIKLNHLFLCGKISVDFRSETSCHKKTEWSLNMKIFSSSSHSSSSPLLACSSLTSAS